MQNSTRTFIAFSILAGLYLFLNIVLPPNSPTIDAYNLSNTEYRVLVLLVGIPLVVVWFASFYGYALLMRYTEVLKRQQEAAAFYSIAYGLRLLAWGLPIIAIISTILGGIVHANIELADTALIIVHYLPVVVSVASFWFISNGSRKLTELSRTRPSHMATRLLFGMFIIVGVLFSYVTITTASHDSNPYHLPMWLILLTIIMPYLYAWFMGLYATYEIYLYSLKTKGVLYRRALSSLVTGIILTIITAVIFQYTQSDTLRLRRISFSWVFVGIYLLLTLYAAGFLLIARGAKRLKKFEEV